MTFFVLLLVLAALAVVEALRRSHHDGRGPHHPPTSHFDDPMFHSPAYRR